VIPPFPRTAVFDGDRLVALGDVDVTALARDFGTPLYVLDRAELEGRMAAWRDAFGPDNTVAYAGKALLVVGVAQLVARAGLALDVASAGELQTALHAGFPPERILFHGNNKSVDELAYGVRAGVGRIVLDNFVELERLAELAREHGRAVGVHVRVTPGIEAGGHDFIRTGHDDSKFGFSVSAGLADEAVTAALAAEGLELHGVHCHLGSQITTSDAHALAVDVLADLLARTRDRHGAVLDELNVGGGLAIVYEPGDEHPVPVAEHARRLRAAVAAACARHDLPLPRLVVEPGRAIAGPAGITLYTVGAVKAIPGVRTYVAVDGGLSDNLRPALYGARYTFAPAGPGPPGRQRQAVTVAGKHCESGDVLGRDVLLPTDITAGDLLAVAATGAYGYVMASNYNRLPRPAMVLVGDGRVDLLVRRESLADLLSHDVALPDAPGAAPAAG
jgi:diaminopimelate decarboxylase